jgi:hypothetical protein
MKIFKIIFTILIVYSASLLADNEGYINHSSLSNTLKMLKKQPSSIIHQQGGWTIISLIENGNRVIWFFSPEEHAAYPAVFKKTIIKKNDGIETIITTQCEAPKAKCDALIKQFMNMNEAYK